MRRSVFAFVLLFAAACNPKKPQFAIGDNFSVWMPEAPTRATSTNDEGLPQTNWEVKHTGLTTAELYSVKQSCYRELLNPDDELQSNEALSCPERHKIYRASALCNCSERDGKKRARNVLRNPRDRHRRSHQQCPCGGRPLPHNRRSPAQHQQRWRGRAVHRLGDDLQVSAHPSARRLRAPPGRGQSDFSRADE